MQREKVDLVMKSALMPQKIGARILNEGIYVK
jgi:predicted nucleotidyltransferase